MKTALSLAALTLAAAPLAQAQWESSVGPRAGHLYVAASAQYTADRDLRAVDIPGGGSSFFETSFDPEFSPAGAIGYHVGYGLRVEVEGSYRQAEVSGYRNVAIESSTTPGLFVNGDDASGDVEFGSLMFNFYYDQPLADSRFEAYIGAGAGVTMTKADIQYGGNVTTVFVDQSGTPVGSPVTRDGFSDTQFSATAQVMAGLTFHATPSVALYGGYRGVFYGGAEFDDDIQDFKETFFHGAEAGIRITF